MLIGEIIDGPLVMDLHKGENMNDLFLKTGFKFANQFSCFLSAQHRTFDCCG
jgi:hypothetical protein